MYEYNSGVLVGSPAPLKNLIVTTIVHPVDEVMDEYQIRADNNILAKAVAAHLEIDRFTDDVMIINPYHDFNLIYDKSNKLPVYFCDGSKLSENLDKMRTNSSLTYYDVGEVYTVEGRVLDSGLPFVYFSTNSYVRYVEDQISGILVNKLDVDSLITVALSDVWSTILTRYDSNLCCAMILEADRLINEGFNKDYSLHNAVDTFLQTSLADYFFKKYDVLGIAKTRAFLDTFKDTHRKPIKIKILGDYVLPPLYDTTLKDAVYDESKGCTALTEDEIRALGLEVFDFNDPRYGSVPILKAGTICDVVGTITAIGNESIYISINGGKPFAIEPDEDHDSPAVSLKYRIVG